MATLYMYGGHTACSTQSHCQTSSGHTAQPRQRPNRYYSSKSGHTAIADTPLYQTSNESQIARRVMWLEHKPSCLSHCGAGAAARSCFPSDTDPCIGVERCQSKLQSSWHTSKRYLILQWLFCSWPLQRRWLLLHLGSLRLCLGHLLGFCLRFVHGVRKQSCLSFT